MGSDGGPLGKGDWLFLPWGLRCGVRCFDAEAASGGKGSHTVRREWMGGGEGLHASAGHNMK